MTECDWSWPLLLLLLSRVRFSVIDNDESVFISGWLGGASRPCWNGFGGAADCEAGCWIILAWLCDYRFIHELA